MNQEPQTTRENVQNLFILLFPLFFLVLKYGKYYSTIYQKLPLPPGPKKWPLIGNILQMGTLPHVSLTHFAKQHGPDLISLKLGSQLLVVGSSRVAANEILKTHDRILSARYVPKASFHEMEHLGRISIVWSPSCTESWKALRTMCRTELFSAKAIEMQAVLREKKVKEMVEFLGRNQGQVMNIGEIMFTTVFDTLSNLFFSKNLIGLEDQGRSSGLKDLFWRGIKLGTIPNIADFYPILAGLDPQGLRKKARKIFEEIVAVWGPIVKERRHERRHANTDHIFEDQDFLDVFLAKNFANDLIDNVILELLSAGTDTTVTTLEWALAELLKNKHVMIKVSEELRREIDGSNSIMESQVTQLPYLNACIKETLRLHPPAPLLLPHQAQETCKIMNYTIPKYSQVVVNVWAIGRDPTTWDDPLSFKPERFLDSNLDFKGHNFEFLPFGAGRRSCPGLPMASKQLPLILATLIYCFDWYLPRCEDPAKLDMNEKFGFTLQKEYPLLLVAKRKVYL